MPCSTDHNYEIHKELFMNCFVNISGVSLSPYGVESSQSTANAVVSLISILFRIPKLNNYVCWAIRMELKLQLYLRFAATKARSKRHT